MATGLIGVVMGALGLMVPTQPVVAATGINKAINFQGKMVANPNGTNIPNGTYNMEFKIYTAGNGCVGGGTSPCGGTLQWTEDWLRNNSQGVTITDGVFQVNLGSISALPAIFNNDTIWLSMNLGSTNATCTPFSSCTGDGEMLPFIRFTAAPYALNSDLLDGLDSTQFARTDANNTFTGTNQLFKNSSNSATALQVQASANATSVLDVDTQNLRVGVNTNAPGYALDVVGDANLSSGGAYRIGGTAVCTSSGCTPVAGSGNYIQNGTSQQTANFNIISAVSNSVGALIQANASQSVDIFEIKGADTLMKFSVNSLGNTLAANGLKVTGATGSGAGLGGLVVAAPASNRGLIVQGNTSQTASLAEFQDINNATLSKFDANGAYTSYGTNMLLTGLATPAFTTGSTGSSFFYCISATNAASETRCSAGLGMANNTSTLNWTQVTGATGYNIYRNTSNSFTAGSLFLTSVTSGATTSFTDTGAATSGTFPSTAPTGTALTVQTWNGQTATAFQVQNATGTNLFSVDGQGAISAPTGQATFSRAMGIGIPASSGSQLRIAASAVGTIGLQVTAFNGATADVIQANGPSSRTMIYGANGTLGISAGTMQTADLLQIQDVNKNAVSKFDAAGALTTYGTNTQFAGLVTPAFTTGSSGSSFYYCITATAPAGETTCSVGLGMANNTSALNWTQVNGATGYKIYRNTSNSFASGSLLLTTITNGATVTFTDTAAVTAAGLPPTAPMGTGLTVQAWNNQTALPLQVKDGGGTTVASFDRTGNLTQAYSGTGDAHAITANSLTTGAALKVTSSNNTAANTPWNGVSLNVTNAQSTTAVSTGQIAGLDLQFTQAPTINGNTETVANFAIAANGVSVADPTVSSILKLTNSDTASGNQIVATDGLNISSAGGAASIVNGITIAGGSSAVTNGLNLSGTFGTNLITASNFTLTQGGVVTAGTWQGSAVGVLYGGTGQTTYTDGQLLIGNSTGNTLSKATLAGTPNRLGVTNGSGSITLNVDATQFPSSTAGDANKVLRASGANAASWVSNTQTNVCSDCATTTLNNLGTTSISASLLTGAATIDLGSNANPFRDLYLGGTATNNFKFTGTATGGAKTVTLDNLSGKLALVQTVGSSTVQTGDLNVSGSLLAPTVDAATSVALNVGTATASSVIVGKTTTNFTLQGAAGVSGSAITATNGSFTTTLKFANPTAARSVTFQDAGGNVCTDVASTCNTTYQAAGSYLAKNASDSSNASFVGNLYSFSNTNSGAAGVLGLTNSGTNSALSINQTSNPGASQALVFAKLTNAAVSGNLVDLWSGASGSETSKFKVDSSGNVTVAGTNVTINDTPNASAFAFQATANSGQSAIAGYRKSNTVGQDILDLYSDVGSTKNLQLKLQTDGSVVSGGTITALGTGNNIFSGPLVVSGVATDITTGIGEDLTVVANGAGVINLNDSVKIGTLGAVSANAAAVCRDTSTFQLIACDSGNTTGRAILQGGNTFGVAADIGTNDAFGVNVRTGGTTRLTVNAAGDTLTYASGGNRTLNVASAASGAGNNLTIVAGQSGSGANNGGDLILQAGATGGSGTSGSVTVKANGTDSTTAFQVQSTGGSNMLTVDTSHNAVIVGQVPGGTAASASLYFGDTCSNFTQTCVKIGEYNGTDSDKLQLHGAAGLVFTTAYSTQNVVQTLSGTNGAATFQNFTNSASAFQVQNQGGTALLNVDTLSNKVTVTGAPLVTAGIASPAAPTLATATTTGTLPNGVTYLYKLAAIAGDGSLTTAVASSPTSVTTSGSNTSKNTLTWSAVTNATGGYAIYRSINGGTNWFKNTVAAGTTTLVDNGTNFTWATAGNPSLTNYTSGVTTASDSLTLQQTGDVFGSTGLSLQNRGGSAGALFTNGGLGLVDFGFVGTDSGVTTKQGNLRYEARPGSIIGAGNTSGELEWLDDATGSFSIPFVTGKSTTAVRATSATALLVQTANGAATFLTADTLNSVLKVGTTATPTLSQTTLFASYGEIANKLRVGTATNGFDFDPTSGPNYSGTARPTKRITLAPEFPGATMTAQSGCGSCSGSMSSDAEPAAGAANLSAAEGYAHNFYSWTTTQASNQNYDIWVSLTLPADFSAFASSNPMFVWTKTTNTTNGTVTAQIFDATRTPAFCYGGASDSAASLTPTSANTWQEKQPGDPTASGCSFAANDRIQVRFRMQAPQSGVTKLGELRFDYLAKF